MGICYGIYNYSKKPLGDPYTAQASCDLGFCFYSQCLQRLERLGSYGSTTGLYVTPREQKRFHLQAMYLGFIFRGGEKL